jgi:molecular chaperone DnaJ
MSYYDILGVTKTSTQDEIKKAFRKKAVEYHPDKGGDETKFKEISEAYETLSDERKKSEYDRTGGNPNPFSGRGSGHGFGMDDIFNQFGDMFGGAFGRKSHQHPPRRKGGDLRVQIQVTLEDVLFGSNKRVKYKRQKPCSSCAGKGGSGKKTCTNCNGFGRRNVSQNTPFGVISSTQLCSNCEGTGQVISNFCRNCNGDGTKLEEETVEINLPKGLANGMSLVMDGQGRFIRDGVAGDLQIIINETPHDKFKREGNDLLTEHIISIPNAVLGTRETISLLDGQVQLDVSPGCESGKVFSFHGKGTPIISNNQTSNSRGTLYVKVNVKIPKSITEEERKLYTDLNRFY